MRHTDSDKVLKTAFLLTTAILVIGSAAALEWESPDDGSSLDAEPTFNVSNDGDSYIVFEIEGPNSETENITGVSGQDYVTYDFSAGSGNSGDYTVNVEAEDGETDSRDFLIDGTDPEVQQKNNGEFVQHDPTLEFTVSDEYTAVTSLEWNNDYSDISVDDGSREDVCGAGGECTVSFDLDTSERAQGDTFTVELTAEDMVGNDVTEDFQYTLDDSYQADEPTFSIDGEEDGVVSLSGDVDVDVTLGNIEEETSDEVQVKCLVDGEEVGNPEWFDADDSEDFSCDIREEDVEDETVDVSVEACDRAGNCDESNEEEITFDASNPEVESFETVAGYNVFGDDFEVEYEAYDSATDIESVEYFFSTAVLPGDGNEINADAEEFKVETSLLSGDSNEHTVYMRVQDEAGHWSGYESLDFEYYPDEKPSLDLSVPENFSVKAGSSKGFDVVVENDGKLMIGSVNVSVESDLFGGEKAVEDLVGGDSQNVEFMVSPNESEIGAWTLEASTDGPVDSVTTEVLVEANTDQRDEVDEKLENFTSRMEELESNISALQEDGLKEELSSSLTSGVESFRQSVQAAEESADQGDYFKAYSELQNIEQEYKQATQSFSKVQEKHRINERNSMIMMVLAGLALILVAGGAFVYTREDYELVEQLEAGEYELPEMGGVKEAVGEKVSDLKSFLKSEEEQVEDAFEGFK